MRPWGPYFPYAPWQIPCLQPHDWVCSCGLAFPAFVNLWRHIGADRPTGWGRPGHHVPILASTYPRTPERKDIA